ncbi:MAG: multicopper oxidase domain-containing protein [Burkholderiales bacterium]|nr:multicopper oxidase domain-containing protein [Burkholderiales bacterium]MDE2394952.1 multicopper oxidase domain-containing protein [Burkholderiales bacterium]MDE2455021.1 multicopper oxidase domain-containing protein [Burkholderiales bacterium]
MSVIWTRRGALQAFAAGAGALATPLSLRAQSRASVDLVLRITALPVSLQMRAGQETRGLRYTGEVLQGRHDAFRNVPGNLGPTLELWRGERVRIQVVNRTSEPTVVHWHGMIVPSAADGHPHQAVASGDSYTIAFTVQNPAGTYLYHPHPHGLTGAQTYRGLAGLLIVRDPAERAFGLPPRENELALVLQDRRFTSENQLVFKRSMMDAMNGVLGDTVLVNGVADAAFKVAPRAYRLRIANVSNARIYKLAWSDDRPLRVIGTDGGLFSGSEGIQERPYVTLFPFQRVELLEDFGARRDGAEIALLSRAFAELGGMGGMMGGDMMGSRMMRGTMGPGQGEALQLARFTVSPGARTRVEALHLPPDAPLPRAGRHELHTQLAFQHMRGFLNGRSFDVEDPTAVAQDERLPARQVSVWTFANDGPGMAMPHPMHVHGVQFRILERRGGDAPADLRDGLVDMGWHDTVGIFPGERVRIALEPKLPGLFMYHCHNLEHEDGGMMRNCVFEG